MDEKPDWEGMFDFSTPHIQAWEVDQIRTAEREKRLVLPPYAVDRCLSRSIKTPDVFTSVRVGNAVEKDLPSHPDRQPGIAFRHGIQARFLKVKVGYLARRYRVVTVHDE